MSAPYAWHAISWGGHPGSTSYGSVPWWRKQRRKTLCFLLTSQEPGSRQGRCRLEKLVFRLQCSTREASIGAVQLLPHAPDSWGPAGTDGARNAFICFNWRELRLGGVLRGLSGPMGLNWMIHGVHGEPAEILWDSEGCSSILPPPPPPSSGQRAAADLVESPIANGGTIVRCSKLNRCGDWQGACARQGAQRTESQSGIRVAPCLV